MSIISQTRPFQYQVFLWELLLFHCSTAHFSFVGLIILHTKVLDVKAEGMQTKREMEIHNIYYTKKTVLDQWTMSIHMLINTFNEMHLLNAIDKTLAAAIYLHCFQWEPAAWLKALHCAVSTINEQHITQGTQFRPCIIKVIVMKSKQGYDWPASATFERNGIYSKLLFLQIPPLLQ